MQNISDDSRGVLFIDLDGTLVVHNYDPENIEDVVLSGWELLKEISDNRDKYFIIVTTSRSKEHCNLATKKLEELGIRFDRAIYGLPTGIRVLVNDSKDGEPTAKAFTLERDKGLVKGYKG